MMKRLHDHPPMFLGLVLSLLLLLAFVVPAAGSENARVASEPALDQVVLRQNIPNRKIATMPGVKKPVNS